MINHVFVVYAYVGSITALLLSFLVIRSNWARDPRQRAALLFLPLVLPIAIYVFYAYLLKKPCPAGLAGWAGTGVVAWLGQICAAGYWLGSKLVPLFVVAAVFALLKLVVSSWYTNSLITRYGQPTESIKASHPALYQTLIDLCREMEFEAPRLIVVPGAAIKSFTFGVTSPTIVISQGLLQLLSGQELRMVLAHELAHITRRDVASSWLAVLLRDLMFFNPVAHWVFALHQAEKEKAADALALELFNEPVEYASALLTMWKARAGFSAGDALVGLGAHLGFAARTNLMESRVRLALDYPGGEEQSKSRLAGNVALVAGVTALILALVC